MKWLPVWFGETVRQLARLWCVVVWPLVFCAGLAVLPGCPSVLAKMMPAIAQIIAVAGEASSKLDMIEQAGRAALAAHPDPELAKRFDQAMAKARGAVAAIDRAAQGAENLNRQDLDRAFADFRMAYQELEGLFGPLGLAPAPGMLRARPDVEPLELEAPTALSYQVPPEVE